MTKYELNIGTKRPYFSEEFEENMVFVRRKPLFK